jgi:hypothetical protein
VEVNVRRTPTILFFFLLWLCASVTSLSAQNVFADQVWDQLQGRVYTTAINDGFKLVNYMVGYLDKVSSASNYSTRLHPGGSYLIVGVCDNNCADVDLALEDVDSVVRASDTATDDTPVIRFTPPTSADYWVKVTMPDCRAGICAYGIGVFRK